MSFKITNGTGNGILLTQYPVVDRCPAAVYLAQLKQSSRRPQKQALDLVASLLTRDAGCRCWYSYRRKNGGPLKYPNHSSLRSQTWRSETARGKVTPNTLCGAYIQGEVSQRKLASLPAFFLLKIDICISELVRLTVSRHNIQNFRYFGNPDLHFAGANKIVEMREFISAFNKVLCRRGRYEV